jgi:CHAT domain-containing protein/tetratricopeptide (TPR) repeat protein
MNSKIAIAYSMVLVLGASMQSSVHRPKPAVAPPPQDAAAREPADLRDLRRRGNDLFLAGQYIRAARIYETGYRAALNRKQLGPAVRFLNNLGSAHYQLFQYRKALQAYLQARSVADRIGDKETAGAICFNLSSLYLGMGQTEAAAQSARQGLDDLRGLATDFRSKLLVQSALVKVRQKRPAEAVKLLRDAVELSRRDLDMATEAQAWNELGGALLEAGDPAAAEGPLLEAFRLRKLARDNRIYFCYENLGRLRMIQGHARSAAVLFGRAIHAARRVSPAALWNGYYQRAQAELAAGRPREAFADFDAALTWLRRWRAEVLPADAFRVSSEVALHEVFFAYINLAGRLYLQTGSARFAEQAFAAAEESRTASLRALGGPSDSLTKSLPEEYWETLSRLHGVETAFAAGVPAPADAARGLRLKLTEMETRAGLDLPGTLNDPAWTSGHVLERTRKALAPDAVYLGFHLGDSESWLWIVGRQGFQLRRLPPAAQIVEIADPFVRAVSRGSSQAAPLGERLYAQLLGGARSDLLAKPVWIVALDGRLFEVPFAALVQGYSARSGLPRYVVEEHAVQIVPGIWSLLRASASPARGLFVGLGDPVYNTADPRFSGLVQSGPGHGAELARLAGSDREIDQCARIWRSHGSPVLLLEGPQASRKNLLDALRQRPAVLHLAVHVMFPAGDPASGLLALTLQPQGGVEFLSAAEVASVRAALGLVVLNGCSSAHAAILPGAGLMGMTRAWLAAGAQDVIATRWPTADDDTELFSYFYENLYSLARSPRRYSFARALQQAQIRQLRAGGRHAGPAFWSAYLCVGSN